MSYFLQRHPGIRKATFRSGWYGAFQLAADVALSMPNMRYYEAPAGFFCSLSNQMPLRHASMSCLHLDVYRSEVGVELEGGLINLKPFSSLKTLTITLGTLLEIGSIITLVASHLSNIEELEIRHHRHPSRSTASKVSPLLDSVWYFLINCHGRVQLNVKT